MLQCQATPISLNLTYNCDPRLLVIIIIIILIEGLMSFMYNTSQTKQSNLLLLMIMMMTIIIIIIIIILFYTSKLLVYLCWFKSSRNYMSVLSLPNNLFYSHLPVKSIISKADCRADPRILRTTNLINERRGRSLCYLFPLTVTVFTCNILSFK